MRYLQKSGCENSKTCEVSITIIWTTKIAVTHLMKAEEQKQTVQNTYIITKICKVESLVMGI